MMIEREGGNGVEGADGMGMRTRRAAILAKYAEVVLS